MKRTEWYRSLSWTQADRLAFYDRLKKCRSNYNKSQYLRIQAWHLAESGKTSDAMELLDDLINNYPEPSQLTSAYLQRAKCLEIMKRYDEANIAYRACILAEQQYPAVQTTGPLDFAWSIVITQHREELFREAIQLVNTYSQRPAMMFFSSQFQAATIRAFVADFFRNETDAATFAASALAASEERESGLPRHKNIGLVNDVDGSVIRRLHELARHQNKL